MGLIAKLIVILIGLIILLIGLNLMVTVAIIIIKAVGVDQAHGAIGGQQPWSLTLQNQRQINLPTVTGGERREMRKPKIMGERRRMVRNKHF